MKKNIKNLILTLILALSLSPSVKASASNSIAPMPCSSIVNIAKYNSWSFYDRSSPQYIELQMETTILSVVGYCENTSQTDDLILYLAGESEHNKNIGLTIPFEADGEPETFTIALPAGEYKVRFTGSGNIKKTNAMVVFSVEV